MICFIILLTRRGHNLSRRYILRIHRLLSFVFLCILLAGCADIEVPQGERFLKDPAGEGSLKTGMTKAQVVSVYGEPDIKGTVISDEWNEPREEWIYNATASVLPVGAGYLSEDLYLYFDGKNLTNISRKPLGKRKGSDIEDVK